MNKIFLEGFLGKDPEIRRFDNGGAITKTSMATTEKWKDKQTGELKSKTDWHNLLFHGRSAEVADKYLKKGSRVLIEGKLVTTSWEKDNVKHYITEVIVQHMTMLSTNTAGEQKTAQSVPVDAERINEASRQAVENEPDDLPFSEEL